MLIVVGLVTSVIAGFEVAANEFEENAYWNVVVERAQKIIDAMGIDDQEQALRVRGIIAKQYLGLHDLHEARDLEIAKLGAGSDLDANEKKARIESVKLRTNLAVRERHYHFVGQLSSEIEADQINKVKDGMTYGVLPLTYGRYMELLPDLEPEHQRQIYAILCEGREFMMDEGSADEKHRRFGKYKGRVNNYVSKLGINMKEAEKALAAKEAAAKARR